MQPNTWASTSNSYTGLDFLIAETIISNWWARSSVLPFVSFKPNKRKNNKNRIKKSQRKKQIFKKNGMTRKNEERKRAHREKALSRKSPSFLPTKKINPSSPRPHPSLQSNPNFSNSSLNCQILPNP
jgi:hypothetical protein